MIKELCLGNWIQVVRVTDDEREVYSPPMRVVAIGESYSYADLDGNDGDCFEYEVGEFSGIPLTVDIVKRAFRDAVETDGIVTIVAGRFRLVFKNGVMNVFGYGGVICDFQYVHELQNVWLNLLDADLTINF